MKWTDDVADSWEAADDDPPKVDRDDVERERMNGGGAIVRDRENADAWAFIVDPVDVAQ